MVEFIPINVNIFFDNDEELNRSFSGYVIPGSVNQSGYYSVDGQGLDGYGLLADIQSVVVNGATSVVDNLFGMAGN